MPAARVAACRCVRLVWQEQQSLAECLPAALDQVPARDRGFVQALVYQTIRHFQELDALARSALNKPLKRKDGDIHSLILVGLCQLRYMDTPDHALVNATVEATQVLNKPWARGLVNALLRKAIRGQLAAPNSEEARWNHPAWLLKQFRAAWPDHWQRLVEANQTPGPMTLRLNLQQQTRADWLTTLEAAGLAGQPTRISPYGVTLAEAGPVDTIPGFSDGQVSVQDEAAQMAVHWLEPQPGERILDACAAPGGKTGHILELTGGSAEVTALDISGRRLARVEENLQRLGLQATLKKAAAEQPDQWWDGRPFDRILLDVPCSGTGVIRRHPDIKLIRRPDDVATLVALQSRLLDAAWTVLKPGGTLLYATCSVLPEENSTQIEQFLARTPGADIEPLPYPDGVTETHGLPGPLGEQWLPQKDGADGFYYCRLRKHPDSGRSTQAGEAGIAPAPQDPGAGRNAP